MLSLLLLESKIIMIKKHAVKIVITQKLSQKIQKKVEDFFNKKHPDESIEFEYEIDNSILGGILIIDGAKYYDGTIKHQLIELRKSIK